ncbi:MAG TPA: VOC family protein [Steroidobacteraceae bacterium]
MHKSCLAGFIIDCRTEDVDAAARFWSQALGLPIRAVDPDEPAYRILETGENGLHIEVQKVDHESRVHLDIMTDDLEAEAARLEKLGAKRVKFVKRWWVMEAPTGQRFCIVRPQTKNFDEIANKWE